MRMISVKQGDCLELMSSLKSGSIDMVLCDPPYGTTEQKWDSGLNWPEIWRELRRVCKPNAAKLFFSNSYFTITLGASNLKEFRYRYVWQKAIASNFYNAKVAPLRQYEEICVFYTKLPTYNPQMRDSAKYTVRDAISRNNICRSISLHDIFSLVDLNNLSERSQANLNEFLAENGLTLDEALALSPEQQAAIRTTKFKATPGRKAVGNRYPTDILTFPALSSSNTRRYHTNQKPVELLEWLIKTYTNEGDTVLDFTMGSGSTGVACLNLGRSFVGFELDEHTFDLARGRLSNHDPRKEI